MNKKVEIVKFVELPYGIVELRSDNILTFRPDLGRFKDYDMQILKEMLEAFKEITGGVPRPYLCDNTGINGILNKDEQAYINEHIAEFATRGAMITQSAILKFLGNTFVSVFKPKVEMKIFKSEDKAINWLLS